jgi:hypothetical protein
LKQKKTIHKQGDYYVIKTKKKSNPSEQNLENKPNLLQDKVYPLDNELDTSVAFKEGITKGTVKILRQAIQDQITMFDKIDKDLIG